MVLLRDARARDRTGGGLPVVPQAAAGAVRQRHGAGEHKNDVVVCRLHAAYGVLAIAAAAAAVIGTKVGNPGWHSFANA